MNSIPAHTRENFEATEDHLNSLRALLLAVDHMADAVSLPASHESDALLVLIATTQAKLREAMKAHKVEWAGFGGETINLTADEIAAARGEK